MTITYTRYYDRATVIVSSEELSDVVSSVYCVLTGINDNGVSLNIGEDIVLDPPQSTNFIPFDQITKDTIDSWILEKEQYKNLELKVAQGIGEMIAPIIVSKVLNFEINSIVDPEVELVPVEQIADQSLPIEPTPIIEPEVPNVDAPSI
jgi:hypothetical protein